MKKIYYLLLFLILIPISVSAMEIPNLYSDKVLLYDPDVDEILYDIKGEEIASIASLTKIMTTIVAIENIKDLDEYVTITSEMLAEVPYDASIAGLKVNDRVTYKDLLYASMLPSGADATTALAYGISGSSDEYIKLMNEKAHELGLNNTHYSNVTGYDIDNHYSTAKEVLELLLYSLDNDLFNEIYKAKTYTLSNGLKIESTLNKYNRIYGYDLSSILGSKTGFTGDAGLCMSSIIKVVDKELILITLGADYRSSKSYNLEDALTVIDYLNTNYKNQLIYKKDDILFSIPVKNSNIDSFDIKVGKDIVNYLDNNYNIDDFKYEYEGLESLSYKNKKGDKIGTIKYYYKDKLIDEDSIYLNTDINISFVKYFKSNIQYFILLIIVLIALILKFKYKRKRKNIKNKWAVTFKK